jgi:hypothetical protein
MEVINMKIKELKQKLINGEEITLEVDFKELKKKHPWLEPTIYAGLMVGFYMVGKAKGMQIGKTQYISQPDIANNANAIFDKAAESLALADEISTFTKESITKF